MIQSSKICGVYVCLSLLLACLLPVQLYGTDTQQQHLVMRMIGDALLDCVGDQNTRVLPVELKEDRYHISFSSDLGFDPADLISVIGQIMSETRIAAHYFVEVKELASMRTVHSFEVNEILYEWLPCEGRYLPEDNYLLVISLYDYVVQTQMPTQKETSVYQQNYLICLLLFLGLIVLSLLARIIIPHLQALSQPTTTQSGKWIGNTFFNQEHMYLRVEEEKIDLSHKEAALFAVLHENLNRPVAREILLQRVWQDEGDYVGRTLDVFISKLRKKITLDKHLRIMRIKS